MIFSIYGNLSLIRHLWSFPCSLDFMRKQLSRLFACDNQEKLLISKKNYCKLLLLVDACLPFIVFYDKQVSNFFLSRQSRSGVYRVVLLRSTVSIMGLRSMHHLTLKGISMRFSRRL